MLMDITLRPEDRERIDRSRTRGWILEPDAKAILENCGLDLPRRAVADDADDAIEFMRDLGSPVAVKAVSEKILHKTEYGAVALNIDSPDRMRDEVARLLGLDGCTAVLVEEMVSGVEVFVGAKNDPQFGPVVILGMGGTSVEIYNDTAIRMAPLTETDVRSMAGSIKAAPMFTGFRGGAGIDMNALCRLVVRFSHICMAMEDCFDAMDLNPVICNTERCAVADARIILTT